jgi:hypothetical protein
LATTAVGGKKFNSEVSFSLGGRAIAINLTAVLAVFSSWRGAITKGSDMSLDSTLTATAQSKLPDPTGAGFADKLYRLDGGHSLANDESVWTPGENVGRSIAFSSTCWLIQRGSQWLLWDTGVPESALNDPKGWSTLPKLIVYHLDNHLCRGVPHSRRPHWQCSPVPGFNGYDTAGRV